MNNFEKILWKNGAETSLFADGIHTLQVNVGSRCNLNCRHCHLGAGSEKNETMPWPVMESILRELEELPGCLVDVTGGAPELNPNFMRFASAVRETGHPLKARTNLTVFFEPGMDEMPEFYKSLGVWLVASLPCYLEENVRAQRGEAVYEKSIKALQQLNALGYGVEPELKLDLVYNPGGGFLPPDQQSLEADYKRELKSRFGVRFSSLLCLTNMPIGRFLQDLEAQGKAEDYRFLLEKSFNPATVDGLMCRRQICVGWAGTLYDCDFNLALELPVISGGKPVSIGDMPLQTLARRRLVLGGHCFGCTAGCGSSCGGVLVDDDEKQVSLKAAAGGM